MVIGHGARFTVLSDAPIAAAIAGCVIPLSRNSTIWMRWRCAAVSSIAAQFFSRRTSALLHLTICLPQIRWRKQITPRPKETIRKQFTPLTYQKTLDSSRFRGGISTAWSVNLYGVLLGLSDQRARDR